MHSRTFCIWSKHNCEDRPRKGREVLDTGDNGISNILHDLAKKLAELDLAGELKIDLHVRIENRAYGMRKADFQKVMSLPF